MKGIASTLATIWRLASPYFYSEERLTGRALLAAVVATELSLVAINVMLNASSWPRARAALGRTLPVETCR